MIPFKCHFKNIKLEAQRIDQWYVEKQNLIHY